MYQRIIVPRPGLPEVMELVREPIPEPNIGEVLVRVLTAGVAFGDVAARRGHYPWVTYPFTPGYDIVGIIEKHGPGVTAPPIGQLVAAFAGTGGYTELICLQADNVISIPDTINPHEAVCLILNYVTAYQLLHRIAKVTEGERVLIHSAAGGVGSALLQLGYLAGLRLYGVASTSKHALITDWGGIPIDYQHDDFVAQMHALTSDGVDVVFDGIGGTTLSRSLQILKAGGKAVAFGFTSATSTESVKTDYAQIEQLQHEDASRVLTYGIAATKRQHPEWFREDFTQLLELLHQQKIKPLIASQFPLKLATHAHQTLESGRVAGKVVLTCMPM